jgi:hypothetical protein
MRSAEGGPRRRSLGVGLFPRGKKAPVRLLDGPIEGELLWQLEKTLTGAACHKDLNLPQFATACLGQITLWAQLTACNNT